MSSRNYLLVKNWKRIRKLELIKYKGGKCERCGYDNLKYPSVFHFHHINPSEKEYTLATVSRSLSRVKEELNKCILLCANCHAETHEDLQQDLINQAKLVYESVDREPKVYITYCKHCNKKIEAKTKRRVYCSNYCKSTYHRKVERPSKESLLKDVEELGYTATGRKYGVSDNAIRKWLK